MRFVVDRVALRHDFLLLLQFSPLTVIAPVLHTEQFVASLNEIILSPAQGAGALTSTP